MKLKYNFDGIEKPGCMSVGQVIMDLYLRPEAEPHRGAVVIIPVSILFQTGRMVGSSQACAVIPPKRTDGLPLPTSQGDRKKPVECSG